MDGLVKAASSQVYRRGRFEVKDFYLDNTKSKASSPLPASPQPMDSAPPLGTQRRPPVHYGVHISLKKLLKGDL